MLSNIHRKFPVIAIALILTLLIPVTVAGTNYANANSLTSSYEILKNDYPDYVQRLKDGGVGDAEIQNFLTELDIQVKNRGPLTEANFNSVLFSSLRTILLEKEHEAILNAMLDAFSEESSYMLANNALHPNMLPLRNAVRDTVLNTEQGTNEEQDGSEKSSNSSSSSNQASEQAGSVDYVDYQVKKQLSREQKTIFLELEKSSKQINISAATLKKIAESGKEMEISSTGLTFRFPPNAIQIPVAETLTLSARSLQEARVRSAVQNLSSNHKLVGSVYEFYSSSESSLSGISFKRPVNITLSYADADISGIDEELLDVFFYDENRQQWMKMDGVVDIVRKTVSFESSHFSKYAIIATTKADQAAGQVLLSDLSGHWAEESIKELLNSGTIKGYPDNTFRPDTTISRAEFAAVLVKVYKLEAQNGKVFNDTANHWAKEYIATAQANDIVNGYSDSTFGPDDNISREQMAVMVLKAAKLSGNTVEKEFTDSARISPWAREAVALTTGKKIITGYPDNTFKPQGSASRAEAVTVIVRTQE